MRYLNRSLLVYVLLELSIHQIKAISLENFMYYTQFIKILIVLNFVSSFLFLFFRFFFFFGAGGWLKITKFDQQFSLMYC